MRPVARLHIRFAPVAWFFGVGSAGYGVGGFVGAGVALMLPATLVFAGGLVDPPKSSGTRRKERTLRHRYLLWFDQTCRKLERGKQLRLERKDAERRFLEGRNRGR